jgi:hypothetical protein
MASKYMKKYLTSLSIKMQIETTLRFHLSSAIMTIFKGNNNKCWQGYFKTGTLINCCGECKLVQPLWKTV